MKTLKRTCILLAVLLVLVMPGLAPVNAQSYSFAVPDLRLQVVVHEDASATLIYDITFENYGSPIDIVDIGLPHDDYSISNMKASIGGGSLSDIRTSTYIDTGVEIHLHSQEIPAGRTGILHFEATLPDMVYQDTTDEALASLQITPTWFDSSLLSGTTHVSIRVVMLPGIELDEIVWQDVEFTDKLTDKQGRSVVVFDAYDVYLTSEYRVGVSFPQRGLERVVKVTAFDLLFRWLTGAGAVFLGCLPFGIFGLVFFGIIRAIIKGSKPQYLPPIAQVEGGGIKRGLTAPEAAAILELPLNKILMLVLFGMLEKGLVRQIDDDPLKLEVVEAYRVADKPQLQDQGARNNYRRTVAQQNGTVIHNYEYAFLDLLEDSPGTAVKNLKVVKPMEGLVNIAAAKMKGFDLSDTQDYYKRVIERAMNQAATIGEIEQREQYLDRYYPWVMMNPTYRPVTHIGGYHYWPAWARASRASSVGSGSKGSSGSGTRFGDVTASFAGWTENTMGGLAAAIMPTRLSKPAPPSTSSGRSGGSSCACACAGCACACACAGGGR